MKIIILLLGILTLVSCKKGIKIAEKNTVVTSINVPSAEVKEDVSKVVPVIEEEKVIAEEELKENNSNTVISEESIKSTIPNTTTTKKEQKEVVKLTPNSNEDIEIELEESVKIEKQEKTKESVSYNTWNDLLKKYVDDKGNVAYGKFKKDEATLQVYLDFMSKNKPTQANSENEKLAYYINLYNAATVNLILKNYPIKSIKDIKDPWGKEFVKIGNELLSLGHIEHKILRKMNEPRVHFAINCASFSCPQLINIMFTASNMEQELEKAAKRFVNDTSRNQFKEKANLSKIFKWYKSDFTDNGTLLEYIAKYKVINTGSKVEYLDYNWSLNEIK